MANEETSIETPLHAQAYYWAQAWQEGEQAALRDLAAGDSRIFHSARDAIRYLLSEDEV
jgi:hypothetical protein